MSEVSAFFVRNWQFTLVLFAGLAIFGVNSLLTIARAEDPAFPIPFYIVKVVLPGAGPVEMEKLVSKPIEDAINGLEDIVTLRSNSLDGVAVVQAEFSWDIDVDRKFDEVVREVNAVRPTLPSGVIRVEVEKASTAQTNIVQMAFVSDNASYRELEDAANDLRDIIDRVPGVKESIVYGAPKTEVRVAVDMGKLSALGIPVTTVANALKAEGVDAPPGVVYAGDRRFNIKATGAFDSLDEVRQTVLLSAGGSTLRVGDVAEVSWAYDEHRHVTRWNGKPAVYLTANQKAGENVFVTRDGIYKAIEEFEKELPQGMSIKRGFDQSKDVEHRLSGLARDFAIALALVLVTLLPLGLRASLIVMISIPLSLAIGVAVLKMTGFTLNQLSIAGFVLALGLLVDDSIVVTENIARHLRSGMSRREAAIAGSKQIGVAVVGCTATLMLAFTPLLFLPEGAGAFIRSLPASVLYTVAASLLVSLSIIPFLASRLLSEHEHPEGNWLLRGVMAGIHTFYRPLLHVALAAPRFTLLLATIMFGLSLMLIPRLGFSLFPPAEVPQILVNIELPDGAAMSETDKALRRVEGVIGKSPAVNWFMSNLGRGNPQIFYNVRPEQEKANHASIFVGFKEWNSRETPKLLDAWRAQFAKIPGAQVIIVVFENGPPLEAPIAVRISGKEMATLKELAARATALIESVPGARDVVNPLQLDRTDLNLGLDTAKAATLGVPAGALDQTVRIAVSGEIVGRYRQSDGDEFDITLRLPFKDRHEIVDLDRIYVPVAQGPGIPLSHIASPRFQSEPARIDRYKRERTVTITGRTGSGFLTSAVSQAVFEKLKTIPLPPGYRISAGGQAEAQARSFGGLGNAVLIALFGIMAVLILEFRSFKASGVVAGVIPLGIIGGLFGLWFTGYPLAFTAIIGFIALIGIEIKNSILLVDFTQQLRAEGVPLRDAIEQAGEIRFLPVLLTSATAIGGLMPLALEASGLYSPLAIVIIGGLISSTFLSRLVTPVMYLLLADKDE
ncbi:MAG: efflux RND transporter permease subunit [Alphaproteobacteria bacterium]|nr:efflux RND transporter permease subunit [Alphaproteobacteria bacterium]